LRYHVESEWEHRQPKGKLVVDELFSATPTAYAALWRFCCEVDWVTTISADDRPVDEPLPYLLGDARAVRQVARNDFLWLRLLNAPEALSRRCYSVDDRVVLELKDPLGYATGRLAVEGGPAGATCTPTSTSADITLDIGTLGAVYLGGTSLSVLHAAGLVDELRPRAIERVDTFLRSSVAPWCSTWF